MARICFVTPWDVSDRRAWSGTITNMIEALSPKCDLVPLSTWSVRDSIVDRAAARAVDGFRGRRYLVGHALATARKRAQFLDESLEHIKPDAVIAVAASQDIAFTRTRHCPIVQVSDLTWNAAPDLYSDFANLLTVSALQGRAMSHLSQRKTDHFLAATEWVQDLLHRDEQIPLHRISLAPFGPGITATAEAGCPERPNNGRFEILSVISNWNRKGGDRVLQVAEELRQRNFPFQLTVVGKTQELPDYVRDLGFVTPHELAALYSTAHVLLEPARGNASGITLTDAAAFGLPAVTTLTGGVGTIVKSGHTGFTVPEASEFIRVLADRVEEICRNWEHFSQSAWARSQDVLNWDRWSDTAIAACDAASSPRG